MWKGETAFGIKKGTTLPETLQQQFATTKTQPRSEPQKVTPQVIQYNPRTRFKEITTPPTLQESAAAHTTKGPCPSTVHVGPRTAFYIPEPTHDGPDIKRLIPWRQTKVQPVGERHNARLVEDEWTTEPAKTSDKPWTGWTNFEEHQEFPTQLESDDEEQQQGTKAKAVERQTEQSPKAIQKLPITQLGFGYIKGFDDSNAHPTLTAIDIQSGMIMALQLTDKRMLFDYAATQLQHFLIECGRTTHTILQPVQEDFLTALITAVAATSPQGTQEHTVHNHKEE